MSLLEEITPAPRRIMTLFYLIDSSGSMKGTKIGTVNAAMEECIPLLREVAQANDDADIKVAIIPCGYADGFNVREQRDMFRIIDKIRCIVRDFKDSFKDKNIYVDILESKEENKYKKCKVLGRLGMYHITVDITGTNVKINDEVKLNVNPMFVDSIIRREYL